MKKSTKPNIDLNQLLSYPRTLSEKFHAQTKLKAFAREPLRTNLPKEWKKIYFKGYARLDQTHLPAPNLENQTLKEALNARKSATKFSKKPISKKDISSLLYFSAGLKNLQEPSGKRFYPSAGSRYPLEIYILSCNTELENGLYHYYIKDHSLENLMLSQELDISKYFREKWVKKSAFIIILTTVFARNQTMYGDRGYRHILSEVGCIAGNMYLVAAALGLICSTSEDYLDDDLNKLLDIDGLRESTIYTLALGHEKI